MQVDAAETADGRLVVLHARQLQQLMPHASDQQVNVSPVSGTDDFDCLPACSWGITLSQRAHH